MEHKITRCLPAAPPDFPSQPASHSLPQDRSCGVCYFGLRFSWCSGDFCLLSIIESVHRICFSQPPVHAFWAWSTLSGSVWVLGLSPWVAWESAGHGAQAPEMSPHSTHQIEHSNMLTETCHLGKRSRARREFPVKWKYGIF